MIKAAQPGRAGTVGSTIVHLSIYRQRRGLRWRPFLSQLLTHRAELAYFVVACRR
jgi:heme oxygenase